MKLMRVPPKLITLSTMCSHLQCQQESVSQAQKSMMKVMAVQQVVLILGTYACLHEDGYT